MFSRIRFRPLIATLALGGVATLAAACGDDSTADAETLGATDIRVVAPQAAAALLADAPDDLVVLDVRTAEEFAEGHVEGATMLDFYRDDFADRLAELPRDVPYVVYCRSGNRSGQTRTLMDELGFTDVADVDGGVVAWADVGLPLVTG